MDIGNDNGYRTRQGQRLSVASRHPEGLSEGKIKQLVLKDNPPGRQYLPRKRKKLSADEQEQIVECYLKKNIPQNEVAKRNRVTPQLVRDLVRESRKKPEKL